MKCSVFQEEPSQNYRLHVATEPIRSSPIPDADFQREVLHPLVQPLPREREWRGCVWGDVLGCVLQATSFESIIPSFSPLDCTKIEIEFQRQDNDPASKHLKTPGLCTRDIALILY